MADARCSCPPGWIRGDCPVGYDNAGHARGLTFGKTEDEVRAGVEAAERDGLPERGSRAPGKVVGAPQAMEARRDKSYRDIERSYREANKCLPACTCATMRWPYGHCARMRAYNMDRATHEANVQALILEQIHPRSGKDD